MKGFVTTCDGAVYQLPTLFAWRFSETGAEPCDSFSIRCSYDRNMAEVLRRAVRFTAKEDEKTAFCGVVDEYQMTCDERGLELEITGRGMAALLLDNEAEAVTYQCAAMTEILKNHVLPYGIRCTAYDNLRANAPYKVASGSSQWKALRDFTHCYGGFLPHFERNGTLTLTKKRTISGVTIDETVPVTAVRYCDRRYGVISEAVVIDKKTRLRQIVRNANLYPRGGMCRRIFYVPAYSGQQAMRYTGEYQIERSCEDAETMRVTVSGDFDALPGGTVTIRGGALGVTGAFRVTEVVREENENGRTTEVTMQRE
ncbi:MAG: hypothetical protein Q3995_06995 [Eubacteriales bacterium]|nr:hypothetical protein [Eubacteriales bacterium]